MGHDMLMNIRDSIVKVKSANLVPASEDAVDPSRECILPQRVVYRQPFRFFSLDILLPGPVRQFAMQPSWHPRLRHGN